MNQSNNITFNKINRLILLLTLPVFFNLNPASANNTDTLCWKHVENILSQIKAPVFPDKEFNILDFGAKGDGITDCTDAFAKAIEKCSKSGGGRVTVPEGTFLTGAIRIKSNSLRGGTVENLFCRNIKVHQTWKARTVNTQSG